MNRRVFNMVTVGLVVVGIGYLVAVAARSLPGQEDEGQLVDFDFSLPSGIQNAIVWMLMGLAGLGALFLVLAIKKGKPTGRPTWRSLYTVAVWIVLMLIIFRYARPILEEGDTVFSELEEPAGTVSPGRDPTLTVASWIVTAVIAAAIAAALMRLASVARSGDWRFDRVEPETGTLAPMSSAAPPIERMGGNSPSARIINAYADFEDGLANEGHGRAESETARHHARRVELEMSLDHAEIAELSSGFEAVRYGENEVDGAAADRVESAWSRLRQRFGG